MDASQPTGAATTPTQKPWSFGVFVLGFIAWMTIGNGLVATVSLILMLMLGNNGNPTAAQLPFVTAVPFVVFGGAFVLSILIARRTGYRALRDGFLVAAGLSAIAAVALGAIFGAAIFLFGSHY